MNFSRLSRSALAAISAILATIFTLLFVAILAPSSQAQSPPETSIISTEINRDNIIAFNRGQALKQDFSTEEEALSALFAQAAIQFRLRDMLTKYGIPPEESVLVKLEIGNQETLSYELAPGLGYSGYEPIVKSFRAAIIEDFIAPANVSLRLTDNFRRVHNMPQPTPEEETKFKITFKSQDFEVTSGITCVWIPPYWRYF